MSYPKKENPRVNTDKETGDKNADDEKRRMANT
jgi:hypothetical protein